MPNRPPVFLPPGSRSPADAQAERRREADQRRPSTSARGYDYQWRKGRELYLTLHPTCEVCAEQGLIVQATVVDHVLPIATHPDLRLDPTNWRSLCKHHHDEHTARTRGFGRARQGGT